MATALRVQVVNAGTGALLVAGSYSVWVNGSPVDISQPVPVAPGSATVSAKAAGYSSQTVTVTVESGHVQLATVPLTAEATPALVLTFVSGNPVPGVTVSFGSWNGVTDDNGQVSFSNVPDGSYALSATATSYQPLNQSGVAVTSDTRSQYFTLEADASGTVMPIGTFSVTGFGHSLDAPAAALASLDVSEQTYDNTAYQGYFTAAQCQLYIGDLFIDELVVVQYALQQNTVPVFAYCSEFIDAYARGRSIVQGQIVINYVNQGYLYAALARYGALNNNSGDGPLTALDNAVKLAQTIEATTSPKLSPALQQQAQKQLQLLLKTAKPADIQEANYLLKAAQNQTSNFANPLYLHQVFDMRILIGDGPYQTVRTLEKVKLGANEQIVDIRSGEVIAESYAFTARRLR